MQLVFCVWERKSEGSGHTASPIIWLCTEGRADLRVSKFSSLKVPKTLR